MKTLLRKKIIPMKTHSLETFCGKCYRAFRREEYYQIRRYHRSGGTSKRIICRNCILSVAKNKKKPMIVEKWHRHGETELYTRQQVRDLIGRTRLSEDGMNLVVLPHNQSDPFAMVRISVVKGTKCLG